MRSLAVRFEAFGRLCGGVGRPRDSGTPSPVTTASPSKWQAEVPLDPRAACPLANLEGGGVPIDEGSAEATLPGGGNDVRWGARTRIVSGVFVALMSLGGAAYACLCCPWTTVMSCGASTAYSQPTCSYTAGVPGGVAATGKWHVRISRAGRNIDLSGVTAPGAVYRRSNVIEPGDIVSADVQQVNGQDAAICVGSGAEQMQPE